MRILLVVASLAAASVAASCEEIRAARSQIAAPMLMPEMVFQLRKLPYAEDFYFACTLKGGQTWPEQQVVAGPTNQPRGSRQMQEASSFG